MYPLNMYVLTTTFQSKIRRKNPTARGFLFLNLSKITKIHLFFCKCGHQHRLSDDYSHNRRLIDGYSHNHRLTDACGHIYNNKKCIFVIFGKFKNKNPRAIGFFHRILDRNVVVP